MKKILLFLVGVIVLNSCGSGDIVEEQKQQYKVTVTTYRYADKVDCDKLEDSHIESTSSFTINEDNKELMDKCGQCTSSVDYFHYYEGSIHSTSYTKYSCEKL